MNNSFSELSLSAPILKALEEQNYATPTPIQLGAIPKVLAGRDLLATAQTGTGKTAAFLLPMLEILTASPRTQRGIRALILTPTRELALQIAENCDAYSRHLRVKSTVVIGGVPMGRQLQAVRAPLDILIATPGRLLDIMNQTKLSMDAVEFLVLDEADRMLDMGFIRDVRKILNTLPQRRQSLLFSATMSPEIVELSKNFLRNPEFVEVARPATVTTRIEQSVLFVDQGNKAALLHDMLRKEKLARTLVFTRTKHRANRIAQQLTKLGISTEAIHSNKSQNARQRALADFHTGRVKVLVATDIVARGIDVENINKVINFELPNDSESYVHRIGRTARAGAEGKAVSFCSADELPLLQEIEKLIKDSLTMNEDHPYHSSATAARRGDKHKKFIDRDRAGRGNSGGGQNRRPRSGGRTGSSQAPRKNARSAKGNSAAPVY